MGAVISIEVARERRAALTAHAAARVADGSIYVLGAQGQTGTAITEAWIKYREHNKAANYKRAIALWKKRLAKGYTGLHADDCSGLVVEHLMRNKLIKSDLTANGLYFSACKPITKWDLAPGDLVFKKYASKNKMYHVGIYMGDGTVIHSKGRSDGVVREKLSKGGWNRFGRLVCMGDGEVTTLLRTLKKGCEGGDVAAMQTALINRKYSVGKWGADGDFGAATKTGLHEFQLDNPACGTRGKPDNKCGQKTAAKLGLKWAA